MSKHNRKPKCFHSREYLRRGVQTESKRENINPGGKQRRAQPARRSQPCTHADNLALGNIIQPQKLANTTTFRSREVVGPPMEVVVRPTLPPRDQTFHYTGERTSELVLEGTVLNFPQPNFALARTPGNKGPRMSGLVLWFDCCLLTGGSVRLCCRASWGLSVVYSGPDVIL